MTDKTAEQLRACPFCGSKNIGLSCEGQPAQVFFMQCMACKACGPALPSVSMTGGAIPPNIATIWNTRADSGEAVAFRTFHQRDPDIVNYHNPSKGAFDDYVARGFKPEWLFTHTRVTAVDVRDAERYRWLRDNIAERLTDESCTGSEFAEHKTQYVIPKLIAWADFCGQITFDEAIDAAIASREGN